MSVHDGDGLWAFEVLYDDGLTHQRLERWQVAHTRWRWENRAAVCEFFGLLPRTHKLVIRLFPYSNNSDTIK